MVDLLAYGAGPRAESLADTLIDRFGSVVSVASASHEARLAATHNDPAVGVINASRVLLRSLLRRRLEDRPILSSERRVLAFLRLEMAHLHHEQVRALHLDARNHLVREEVVSNGCINHSQVHVRQIVRRALELGTVSIILVHNHPSGNHEASDQDVTLTRALLVAAKLFEIRVLDHIIVGRAGASSFKAMGWL